MPIELSDPSDNLLILLHFSSSSLTLDAPINYSLLTGNPFPPLTKDLSHNRNLLHNVLLDAAKKEFRRQQYEKIAKGSASAAGSAGTVTEAQESAPKVSSQPENAESARKPPEHPASS